MDKKLKEAIADAKTVRETALANAKLALEETFSPQLKSMISARLQQEEEEKEVEEESYVDEETVAEVEDVTTEDMEAMEDELESEEEEEAEEEAAEEMEAMEMEAELEDEEDEDELELEAIIRELESDEDDDVDVEETYNEGEDEKEVEEEGIDLDEIIKSLREEDEESDKDEVEEIKEEEEAMVPESLYKEALETVAELRGTLNEVNVLNAKLLYANKLFRTYNLNESVKAKIIEAIDRAESVREIKLVYSTLAENFKGSVEKNSNKTTIKEGFASKAQPSTKPSKEIITEANTQVTRFQKLAGIKKK